MASHLSHAVKEGRGRSLREQQADVVRARISSAVVRLIESGEEPTMRAVAGEAAIGERTLYRYYASHEELVAAVLPTLRTRASAELPASVEGLADYVRRLFTTFSGNAALARALVTAKWAPTAVTRPANLKALRKLIDAGFPRAALRDRESAAASLRVLFSAASWAYLVDCGFDLEGCIRHVQWNTRVALERLGNRGGRHA